MDPEVRENLYQGMNGPTIFEIAHQSDRKIFECAQLLPNRVEVKECLCWMLSCPVTGIDHRDGNGIGHLLS